MSFYLAKTLQTPFDAAIGKVLGALKDEGFGILTDIDVQATLKEKLCVDRKAYRILGACNPTLAHRALEAEDKIGTMLPCNVVVQDLGEGRTEVTTVDPVSSMERVGNPTLTALATEVRTKLAAVLDRLSTDSDQAGCIPPRTALAAIDQEQCNAVGSGLIDPLKPRVGPEVKDGEHTATNLDGTSVSKIRIEMPSAVETSKSLGSQLAFLSVTPHLASLGDLDHAFANMPGNMRREAIEFLKAEANEALADSLAMAKAAGVAADTMMVESSDPYEAIVATAKAKNADLSRIASHGRSGLQALLLGSVTQKVLTNTDLPILVCR